MINREDETPGAIEWFRYARQVQKEQLHQLAQQGQLVSQLSHVVHMLQCERGHPTFGCARKGRYTPPNAAPALRWWTNRRARCWRIWSRSIYLLPAACVSALLVRCGRWNNCRRCAIK